MNPDNQTPESSPITVETGRQPTMTAGRGQPRPLRLWPGLVFLALIWVAKLVPALVSEASFLSFMIMFMGPIVCALGIVLWWALTSRATVGERVIGILGVLAAGGVANALAHPSVQGFGFILFGVPWSATAFVLTVALVSRLSTTARTYAAVLAACGVFTYLDALRSDGIRGDMAADLRWRWQPTAEDQFLAARRSADAQRGGQAEKDPAAMAWDSSQTGVWPEFRGPRRDGRATGVTLASNWSDSPPREIWRRKIGPGWSSFCVVGDRLFTQEQRGELEAVVCYDANSGDEIWSHTDKERFWETVGGAGPRATPTFSGGKLYTMGANGTINCLDPVQGRVLWCGDLRKDSGAKPPTWGFSSSPLVAGNSVVVHAGGFGGNADKATNKVEKSIVAYDKESGSVRWHAAAGDHSYSSPHLHSDGDRSAVLVLTNSGLVALEPDSGDMLWEHAWKSQGQRVVQPLAVSASSFLLGTGVGEGTRRIQVKATPEGYQVEEEWTSRDMKPYFNDFVSHDGYLYGFDHDIFACIDLTSGKRMWKKGRYGSGQVLLLPDGDQLLILSESGDLVLLQANPQQHQELSRLKVLEGKTWTHPVLVGDRLYVRNGEEAACYAMPVATAAAQ